MRDYSRLDQFLTAVAGEVCPEPPAEPHITLTRTTITDMHQKGLIKAGDKVLDVGCGQGLALEMFRTLGIEAIGTGLGPDVAACRAKGFEVHDMDQNFMTFAADSFDLLWCRHVLDHSIAPMFTLSEYRRLTKPGGLIYVEMPAPETSAHHERAQGRYSVLPPMLWQVLFKRAGLTLERGQQHSFTGPSGPDAYLAFLLRKPAVEGQPKT